MTRRILIAVWAVLALAAGGVLWFYVAADVGDPTEVTAPPITSPAGEETDPVSATTSGESAPTAAESPPPSSTTAAAIEEAEPAGTAGTQTTQGEAAESPGRIELQLAEGTEARFLIFEELQGEPFTVVAANPNVVGRVEVDLEDLSGSQMGDILINARTFVTDTATRDRAIRGLILSAEQYEFITFRPLEIVGLTGSAVAGGEWSFSVEGELTVREVTNPVSFEVVASWDGEGRLSGEASTMVLRSDFGLTIPSVPFVANVADDVVLELDFIATTDGLG